MLLPLPAVEGRKARWPKPPARKTKMLLGIPPSKERFTPDSPERPSAILKEENLFMKTLLGLVAGIVLLTAGGCVTGPPESAGVSVGVYGEYPSAYYGYGYYPYHGWHHPYDRDHYFYRYPHPYYYYYH